VDLGALMRWVPCRLEWRTRHMDGRGRRAGSIALLIGVCVAAVLFVRPRAPAPAPPAPTPPLPETQVPRPPAAWLGLNYNSVSQTGGVKDFAARGIVYDREGKLEVRAGATVLGSSSFRSGLATTYAAGMVPIVQVDPATGPTGCQTNPTPTKVCLPTSQTDVASYVHGFVMTAKSVLLSHRGHLVLLEPTNEPWNWAFPPGSEPGGLAAREYAVLLSRLLPAVRSAGIPLSDVYVPAAGRLGDGTSWIPDLYQARPCLKPGPASCGPIAGWNVHAYGLPYSSTEGIDSVPWSRREMLSGQDNIVVSEIGFCAVDVNDGDRCDLNRPDVVGSSKQAAAWLRETLNEAARMHDAGWLRALLVWERSGASGWAMQHASGSLTAQGRVLDLFAGSSAGR
jgi:hypothetical protein